MVNPTHTLLLLELHRPLYTFSTNLQQCILPANIRILNCAVLYVLYDVYDFYTYTHMAFELGLCPFCNHKGVWNVCTQ